MRLASSSSTSARQRVHAALDELRRGRPVVVLDDADRENEADLILPAEFADRDQIAFFLRHTSGFLCVALPADRARDLHLNPMVSDNTDPLGTAFTVSVDAKGTGTGISAEARATTIRALADTAAEAGDFARPGHVLPLRAHPGSLWARRGHTEAALELCRQAGLQPAGLLCEMTSADKTDMLRGADAQRFADDHQLIAVTIAELADVFDPAAPAAPAPSPAVTRGSTALLPTPWGVFDATVFSDPTGVDHLALTWGDPTRSDALVRIHSECLTGEALHSLRCDCGHQLDTALEQIAQTQGGALIYLRGHEGRGIGLKAKISAYQLQDRGHDTVDANLALGLPADARDYQAAGAVLRALGVHSMQLLTNNPDKLRAIGETGFSVTRALPIPAPRNQFNTAYLETKRLRFQHLTG
ncbi:GTP cyclohydrolase II [Gordonia caeni]|uniref:GTP cyclohydrolase-2 n=1 Tax=Gordonia caeni TaxID=1007097 RepID=A0ABP7NV27_9ACTN